MCSEKSLSYLIIGIILTDIQTLLPSEDSFYFEKEIIYQLIYTTFGGIIDQKIDEFLRKNTTEDAFIYFIDALRNWLEKDSQDESIWNHVFNKNEDYPLTGTCINQNFTVP